jgi:lysophospholipase L1-like esterase
MLDAYVEAVRDVARERACSLIDAHAAFLAAQQSANPSSSPAPTDPSNPADYHLTCDGVHLSDAGAALVADLFHDWLLTL